MNGHLFGAGDEGAARDREQRRRDAARRNAERAKRDVPETEATAQGTDR
ncbi:MAG: hypothetical protein ACRDS0_03800 [Pseudonocardiaceae bacterium]